ncbi:MAG TPA: hypothetical protein PLZ77_05170 [Lachnospiraceae bacterium]|nr:hypothetical protein [Lachnospiraceae bacterium]HPF29482.1 hypothetical protein [Lachnospiraceae bacterium]
MTIHDRAEFVAEKVAGGRIIVEYDIPENNMHGYVADTGLRMSGEKMKQLG